MRSSMFVLCAVGLVFAQTSYFDPMESGVTVNATLAFPAADIERGFGVGVVNNGRFGVSFGYASDKFRDTEHDDFSAHTLGGAIEIALVQQCPGLPVSVPLFVGYTYFSGTDLPPMYAYIYSHELSFGGGIARIQTISEVFSVIPELKFGLQFGRTTIKEESDYVPKFPYFKNYSGSTLKPAVSFTFKPHRRFGWAVTPALVLPFGEKNGQSWAFVITVLGILRYS